MVTVGKGKENEPAVLEPEAAAIVPREPNGRWLPGKPPGPGRPAVPQELKDALPDLIRLQIRAALDGFMPTRLAHEDGEGYEEGIVPVAPKVRAAIADRLTDRVLGKAVPIAQADDPRDLVADLIVRLASARGPNEDR